MSNNHGHLVVNSQENISCEHSKKIVAISLEVARYHMALEFESDPASDCFIISAGKQSRQKKPI